MTTWAILATGPSMSQEQADAARAFPCVAVSDAYRLAPWARALVSADSAWWRNHPKAAEFDGRKLCAAMSFETIDFRIERMPPKLNGCNSGLLACQIAVDMGATRLILLGFDMAGSHFFGQHPAPLKNTKPARFEVFKSQFAGYKPRGVQIVNATPRSALSCFPMTTLEAELARSMQSA